MRGQRLFVRPIEKDDRSAIEAFLTANGNASDPASCGLLGKLVGDLVAVLTFELTPNALQIANLVVAPDFRRKRIGRFMLDEASRLARKMDRNQLVIDLPGHAQEFLSRAGFAGDEQRMVRRVE
jgi:ribosomal protein S18 acetylase RimI-like enzyme